MSLKTFFKSPPPHPRKKFILIINYIYFFILLQKFIRTKEHLCIHVHHIFLGNFILFFNENCLRIFQVSNTFV